MTETLTLPVSVLKQALSALNGVRAITRDGSGQLAAARDLIRQLLAGDDLKRPQPLEINYHNQNGITRWFLENAAALSGVEGFDPANMTVEFKVCGQEADFLGLLAHLDADMNAQIEQAARRLLSERLGETVQERLHKIQDVLESAEDELLKLLPEDHWRRSL